MKCRSGTGPRLGSISVQRGRDYILQTRGDPCPPEILCTAESALRVTDIFRPQEICLNALLLTLLALVHDLVRIVFWQRRRSSPRTCFCDGSSHSTRSARPADVAPRRPRNSRWSSCAGSSLGPEPWRLLDRIRSFAGTGLAFDLSSGNIP